MPLTLPTELFYALGSLILVFIGWLWRNLDMRVTDIEEHLAALREDLAAIKQDIEWIKNLFDRRTQNHGKTN
mgnify:CR=1 FL=1